MPKMIMVLLIASSVVAENKFADFTSPSYMFGGLLAPGNTILYSTLAKQTDCKLEEKIKMIYDKLVKAKAPVAKILGMKSATSLLVKPGMPTSTEQTNSCYIFYKNTLKLDVIVEDVYEKIKTTLNKLKPIMAENNLVFLFRLQLEMFMYDSENNMFVFRDFENIGLTSDVNININPSHEEIITDIESLNSSNYFDKIFNFNYNHNDYIVNEDLSLKKEFMEVGAPKQNDKDAANVLMLRITEEDDKWKFTSTLGPNTDTLLFDKKKEVFSLYFCQKVNENKNENENECIILDNKGIKSLSWNFGIKENHKINIEVRRINSADDFLGLLYYKVFLTPIDIDKMRIVPTHSYLRDENEIPSNEADKEITYKFYDNGVDSLKISVLNSEPEEEMIISLKSKVEFDKDIKVHLLSPNYYVFSRSNFHHKDKYYLVRIPIEKIIVVSEEENDQPVKIRLVKKTSDFNFSFFKSCRSDVLIYDLDSPKGPFRLKYKGIEKFYPEKFVLEGMNDQALRCFDIQNDNELKFSRYSVVPDDKVFYWNFNLHKNHGTIQFFDKSVENYISFPFKDFVKPSKDKETAYLSITRKNDGNFDVRMIYFKEEVITTTTTTNPKKSTSKTTASIKMFEVSRENLYSNPIKLFPTVLTYFNDAKNITDHAKSFNFNGLDVTYLSDKEIVYTVKITSIPFCSTKFGLLLFEKNHHLFKCYQKSEEIKSKLDEDSFEKIGYIVGLKKVLEKVMSKKILRII